MNDLYRSWYNFKKYKPQISKRRSFFNIFRKKKRVIFECTNTPRRNYHTANPHFTNGHCFLNRNKIAAVFLFIIIMAWAAILLFLPYFRIDKITYLGLEIIKKEEIDAYIKNELLSRKFYLPRSNYFFINIEKISDKLKDKYALDSIKITKILPCELRIDLQEKISTIIYDNGLRYYLLDKDGRVIRQLADVDSPEKNLSTSTPNGYSILSTAVILSTTTTSTVGVSTSTIELFKTHKPEYRKIKIDFGNYPIVYDTRNIIIENNNKIILPPNIVDAVIRWNEMLAGERVAAVRYMVMDDPLEGITAYVNYPWRVLFRPADGLREQFDRMKIILKDYNPNEYIDLRFGNRVYWK